MLSIITITSNLKKASSNPKQALHILLALGRGWLIKGWYSVTKPQVQIGSNFLADSWLHIKGPGKVIIGDKVGCCINFLRPPCILTHTKDSVVTIGDRCYIGGASISCVEAVTIGDDALLGSSMIIDSDIIPHELMTIDPEWKKRHTKPIKIGNQFWSGTNSTILGGSIIGNECVLGAGAVFVDKKVGDRALVLGNPGRKIAATRS
jgi:acetyltransferase-like isoleucine patch superfamily enzyme